MSQEKTHGLVYIVTEKSPQSQLFADYLHEHTGCTVSIHSPKSSLPTIIPNKLLILIDSDHIGVEELP